MLYLTYFLQCDDAMLQCQRNLFENFSASLAVVKINVAGSVYS